MPAESGRRVGRAKVVGALGRAGEAALVRGRETLGVAGKVVVLAAPIGQAGWPNQASHLGLPPDTDFTANIAVAFGASATNWRRLSVMRNRPDRRRNDALTKRRGEMRAPSR